MPDNGDGSGIVIRKLVRAHEGGFSPTLPGNRSNFFVIRGYDHSVKTPAFQSGLNRPGNHRLTAELFDVFARNALTAAAGRDNGNRAHPHSPASALRSAATTSLCWSSVRPWNIGRLIASR